METKFNSQICTTIEQSERLIALGLKKETADLLYLSIYSSSPCHPEQTTFELDDEGVVPAWSLHRLIELIWGDGEHDMSLETHRPFEDCIERIDYMINQSHCFNNEYLVV